MKKVESLLSPLSSLLSPFSFLDSPALFFDGRCRQKMDVNPPVMVRANAAITASGSHRGRQRPIDIDRTPHGVFATQPSRGMSTGRQR